MRKSISHGQGKWCLGWTTMVYVLVNKTKSFEAVTAYSCFRFLIIAGMLLAITTKNNAIANRSLCLATIRAGKNWSYLKIQPKFIRKFWVFSTILSTRIRNVSNTNLNMNPRAWPEHHIFIFYFSLIYSSFTIMVSYFYQIVQRDNILQLHLFVN